MQLKIPCPSKRICSCHSSQSSLNSTNFQPKINKRVIKPPLFTLKDLHKYSKTLTYKDFQTLNRAKDTKQLEDVQEEVTNHEWADTLVYKEYTQEYDKHDKKTLNRLEALKKDRLSQ